MYLEHTQTTLDLRYAVIFCLPVQNETSIEFDRTRRRGSNGGTEDVTSRYRNMYEGSLDPFQRFTRQEEARRIRNLNPAERVALLLTKWMFMNKYSRLLFVVYSAMLHVLVLFTLYHLSSWEACVHDSLMPKPVLHVNSSLT